MKLTPIKVKKYNKIAEKKPIMVRVDSKWYTWAEGDPKHGVFLTTQDGKDVEFDFNQIDDIKENVIKLTKSKLKEIVKEEIKLLSEKEAWPKYLKLLGHDARKFKKLDRHAHDYYMKAYKKSADAGEFEQNYSDDLERDITKIPIGEAVDAKKATEIRKKLLKRFGKDSLYKDFIVARTPKEQKKALDTLKSIRGSNAISLMQKYATSLQKESINEGKFNIHNVKTGSIIKYMQPGDRKIYKGKVLDIVSTRNEDFYVVKHKGEKINVEVSYIADLVKESMMFDDYHKLNRAYMDDFIKNYKKLNRKNVVKKKGDDIYGFRKGEREAHWKYDDNFKLHYDIDKAKVLGLINFFNRAKKDHPWS